MSLIGFKPMLADNALDLDALRFPLMASTKLDGIRCLILPEGPRTRSLKPIRNRALAALLSNPDLIGLDGELISGDATAKDVMQVTNSAVTGFENDSSRVTFHVFDAFCGDPPYPSDRFERRHGFANLVVKAAHMRTPELADRIVIHPHKMVRDLAELRDYEEKAVADGYEGVMLRDPNGHYKFGRSSEREGLLLKIKRFEDDEGTVTAFEEMYHNDNPATTSELGRTKRSTSKENMRPAGVLGALIVTSPKWPGVEIRVGGGYTAAQRAELWSIRDQLIGRTLTFKHQPSGAKDAPRFPVFKGWRHADDMDAVAAA